MISTHAMQTICSHFDIHLNQMNPYPTSFTRLVMGTLQMCCINGVRYLLAEGEEEWFSQLNGVHLAPNVRICSLTHENRLLLNKHLPYTCPTAFGTKVATFGTGDRLGLATPSHIRALQGSLAKPILAQQSKRELELTGRNYENVLDDVCFAVFQEGYRDGFGADGDHLKTLEDIRDALDQGYTMITLDCSDRINNQAQTLPWEKLQCLYVDLPADYRQRIEKTYLGEDGQKKFSIAGQEFTFTAEELARCALVYGGAIDLACEVARNVLADQPRQIDFELSIDETQSVTTAQAHLFTAMELACEKITITSLAPRFTGEFQKGIDYIGCLSEFEEQLSQHVAIASHFGYKLSIHSGSDKFSVFPAIGEQTAGILHLKTSGTTWLEAIAAIAVVNPSLYRRIHEKAVEHFTEARSFYHVSADLNQIPKLHSVPDDQLIRFLENDHSRQLLHITYGFILRYPDLKSEIYETLRTSGDAYADRLIPHIRRHLTLLGLQGECLGECSSKEWDSEECNSEKCVQRKESEDE